MKSVLINACGLHLGYLGCYGNDWVATPNIDRLAANGVVFDQHFVATPKCGARGLMDWPEQWSASLASKWESSLMIDGPCLGAPWTFPADMLSVYAEEDEVEAWADPPVGPLSDADAICRVQDSYAAAVTWFDARLGEFLDELDRHGGAEMMLVLTASCGYPLGEHGRFGLDRPWLHEEVVHVPLIVRLPGGRLAGERVMDLTQPDDLAATIAGTTPDRDLIALAGGAIESLRPCVVSSWRMGGRSERAIRTGDWALIVPGDQEPGDPPRGRQLYVKPEDRWEVNDVAIKEVDIADELEGRLNEISATESKD